MYAIAHVGHWALGMLEAAPLAVAVALLGWKTWSDRRAAPAATPDAMTRA